MSDSPPQKASGSGAPAWVMTFADLMSLLMCFFVLLLAFSEMDVLKFKQLAGSMKAAFGVQRDIKAKEIPKGISVIAKEFSPGKPEPTLLNEVRQSTVSDLKRHLEAIDANQAERSQEEDDSGKGKDGNPDAAAALEQVAQAQADAEQIREAFKDEIENGLLDVETENQRVIIRIQEKGSFPSGSATLIARFAPVISRIGEVLKTTEGRIVVAGHTDNIPIATARFRSNWELAAARSVTVVHHLARVTGIDQDRFLIEGYADTLPLAPNDSAENRARNRRVEIVIVRGNDVVADTLTTTTPDGVPDDAPPPRIGVRDSTS